MQFNQYFDKKASDYYFLTYDFNNCTKGIINKAPNTFATIS